MPQKQEKCLYVLHNFDDSTEQLTFFLKFDCLAVRNRAQDLRQSESDREKRSSLYSSKTEQPMSRKLKSKKSVLRSGPALLDFDLNESSLSMRLAILVGFIIVLCLIRHTVMKNMTKKTVALAKATKSAVQIYIQLLAIDTALVELFLWDNKSTINFISPLEFYRGERKKVTQETIPAMESLMGELEEFRKLMLTDMDYALSITDEEGERYMNSEVAMGGIVTKPIIKFLSHYMSLCDNMVDLWTLAQDRAAQDEILARDEFASLVAYTIYNSLGTADAVYYHIVYPTWTFLLSEVETHPSTISFTNTLTYVAQLGFLCLVSLFFLRKLYDNWCHLLRLLFCIPIELIPGNQIFARALKSQANLFAFIFWNKLPR